MKSCVRQEQIKPILPTVSAILGKAKILNISEQHDSRSGQIDFSQANIVYGP
jgi:hypothetical protein